ncbi:MAG: flagellar basal body-associated FliL family protein [Paracoccaceae bacterium]|uniref:flagellar basal body-associated FliL family protein n=1 Tax=Seohaeicola saemankumensis TaxID=481181 RepID=UPI001E65D9E9|nr:flagellar basal body-associated FliL family protein [Seohaeicola saemankumensis]MCD1625110.1 flagellar basal body-associated FliL family protein [Seohaeicola saemankumensis]
MTTKTATLEGDATLPASKGRAGGILRILGLVIGAGVCAGGGFAGGWFMFSDAQSPMSDALRLIERDNGNTQVEPGKDGLQKAARPFPENSGFITSYYSFDETLTTNPAGSRRFVQLGVSLSTQYDAKVIEHVETHKLALRSDMLAVVSSFTEEQITGLAGREALAIALRDAINTRLESLEGFGGVESVFFPSFVIQ